MGHYKVYRYKRYEAVVEAESAPTATDMALDVPGRDWKLVGDEINGLETEYVEPLMEAIP